MRASLNQNWNYHLLLISLLPIGNETADVIVEFTQNTFTGSEDLQSVNVSLRLAAGSAVVPVGGLTVSLTASPGTASGVCVCVCSYTCLELVKDSLFHSTVADYSPDVASVIFTAGQGPGDIQSFTFTIIDDNLVESLESFSVEGDVSAAAIAARFLNGLLTDTVTVNIADNDGKSLFK